MISTFATGLLIAMTSVPSQSPIETSLAWGGSTSTSAFTELSVSGNAEPGSAISAKTNSVSPAVHAALAGPADRTVHASMPVSPAGPGAVVLTTRAGNAEAVRTEAGQLLRSNSRIALVGESVVDKIGELPDAIVVAATALPRLASAYAHIRALVVDATALAQLDKYQLQALLEHMGNCGRTLLVNAPPAVRRNLELRAGCGGEMLVAATDSSALDSQLDTLLDRKVSALPGAKILRSLLGKSSTDLQLMMIYLAGFIIVFVLLSIIPRTRVAALGFCLLATGLAATLWSAEPRETFIAWSETNNGDRIARYKAIERATASARGAHTLRPRSLSRSPHEITGDDLTLHWSNEPTERRLEWSASVLEQAQVVTAGSFPVEPNLRAGNNGEGARVCNHGAATSPPAYVRWRGSTYAVPALEPTAQWSYVDATPVTARLPELRLLASRTPTDSLAILHPLNVPANGGVQHAWLMRLESDAPEASPCAG